MDGMNTYVKPSTGLNPFEDSTFSHSSRAMAPENYRYPEPKSSLRRQVHAPSRILKNGLSPTTRQIGRDRSTQVSGNAFGAFLTCNYDILKQSTLDLSLRYRTDKEVIDVDDELRDVEMISDDTSMEGEFVENVAMEVDEEEEKENGLSSEVFNLKNGRLMVDDGSQANSSLVLKRPVNDVSSFEAYRKIIDSAENRISKLKDKGFGGFVIQRCRALLSSLISFFKQDEESVEDVQREAFLPVSREEEIAVKRAFSANNNVNILVTHEDSNIDITGKILSCLEPGEWLNDEVINLYLVLLKEREAREPKKFLKCHFFNTFFFTKLVNTGTGYNYSAVRRWTSVKRLGYRLID